MLSPDVTTSPVSAEEDSKSQREGQLPTELASNVCVMLTSVRVMLTSVRVMLIPLKRIHTLKCEVKA